ncbi:hypothetical protein [Methylibium sp.]|uniref:hypothetical protein n=1 Tax=Methylibium sp. TaxID=2067992 RepID=UPI00286B776F|nr:hypothetical protein [Methylibium sp.]
MQNIRQLAQDSSSDVCSTDASQQEAQVQTQPFMLDSELLSLVGGGVTPAPGNGW